MQEGYPINLKDMLPAWLPVEDLYIGMAAATLLLVAVTIFSMLTPRARTQARVKNIQQRHREMRDMHTGSRKRRKPQQSVNIIRQIVIDLKLLKNTQIGKVELSLTQAGINPKDGTIILAFANLVAPIICGLIGLAIAGVLGKSGGVLTYGVPILGAYIGLKLPLWYVGKLRKKRYLYIQRALSDTLDLMTICAEAGLSMAAMIDRVSRELVIAYPEMAEELALTSAEMSVLPDRNKALLNLTKRCTLDELRGVVNVLIQTERYGTPIAQALRVLAAEFRQARMLRAEQKAARLPAIMTVPMIAFILPTLFIVILTPAIIRMMDSI